jgi:hypothetical protein
MKFKYRVTEIYNKKHTNPVFCIQRSKLGIFWQSLYNEPIHGQYRWALYNSDYNGFKLLTTSKVQNAKICIQYYIWKKAVELYKLKRERKNKLNFKKRKKVVINIPPWN